MSSNRKKSGEQKRLFNDKHHGAYLIKNSVGILAQLYRLSMEKLGIDKPMWDKYLEDYLRRFAKENPGRSVNAERGNVRKALTKPWMSWKTLLRAFVFAKFKNVKVIIKAEKEDGTIIELESIEIDLGSPLGPIDDDDKDDTPIYNAISRDKK